MDSWRDIAARAMGGTGADGCHQPDATEAQLRTIGHGLRRLAALDPPQGLASTSCWREVRSDALRLHDAGWSARALALGWHPLELFGCGRRSSRDFTGLAVWLAGRRMILIDNGCAVAAESNRHGIFRRRADAPALIEAGEVVGLWEFGRDG